VLIFKKEYMRVSDFIVARLAFLGIDTSFLVTGGGAMYLNDAIGASKFLKKIYCHHEQGASIAAEAYARVALKPALLNVTTGPGSINALNGVFGAYTDSIPMVVVSGQVKRETMLSFNPVPGLRQLGDQEVDIISMAKPITKWAYLLKNPEEIAEKIDEAFFEAVTGKPGPTWLDVPVDVQGAILPEGYEKLISKSLDLSVNQLVASSEDIAKTIDAISNAKRPVILAGSGIRIAGMATNLVELVELLDIPVVTAWTHDIFPNDHRLFAGRPGTIGTRAGNFVVQNADLVIVLGSRLNIRQVSYNWSSFARNAKKIWVDIDPAEFKKPYVSADLTIAADLKTFMPSLISQAKSSQWKSSHNSWVQWCAAINARFTPKAADYPVSEDAINSYHFIAELFDHLRANDIVVCGDATATIVPFQIGKIKSGMRLFSNSGSASMGYDIPAALGAAIANPDARIICLAGDGSSMMNIQELETISGLKLNVLVFILNNDGYLSIKQTQRNFFKREAGSSSQSGLSFPDFKKLGEAFSFKSIDLKNEGWKEKLKDFLNSSGPSLCNTFLDLHQEFEPRLKSKMVDGVISTPELDDMHPFLDPKELASVRNSALKIN
jgi:acetolactate synthase-1/2/3 large subunit